MDYQTAFWILLPVAAALIGYFVRLETRLSTITNDLKWIKANLKICQPD